MIRFTLTLACLLLCVTCALGIADRFGLTETLWREVLPPETLQRPLSPREKHLAEIQAKSISTQERIAETQAEMESSRSRRHHLLADLGKRCVEAGVDEETRATGFMARDPLATALIRSIAAEDERLTALARGLESRKADLIRLEARAVSLRNGVGLLDEAAGHRPSVHMRETVLGREKPSDRYDRILREAVLLVSEEHARRD